MIITNKVNSINDFLFLFVRGLQNLQSDQIQDQVISGIAVDS